MPAAFPDPIDETLALLTAHDYVAERSLATALFLALRQRPLFLEGEAGVGKTEVAKVVARALGRKLVRLQCYEGLDIAAAVYEWNYQRQMLEIRLAEAAGQKSALSRRKNRPSSSSPPTARAKSTTRLSAAACITG